MTPSFVYYLDELRDRHYRCQRGSYWLCDDSACIVQAKLEGYTIKVPNWLGYQCQQWIDDLPTCFCRYCRTVINKPKSHKEVTT